MTATKKELRLPKPIQNFLNSIDCYVMGSRTYEYASELSWPYGDVPVFALTHKEP